MTEIDALKAKQWNRATKALRVAGNRMRFDAFVAAMFGNSIESVRDRRFQNADVLEMIRDGQLVNSWDDYGWHYVSLPTK